MAYNEDIEFVLSECVRYAAMDRSARRSLPPIDALSLLPHPSGRGFLICGSAAARRLREIAGLALSRSDYAGRLDIDEVARILGDEIVQRFLREERDLDMQQAQRAVNSAVKKVSNSAIDLTHFIPCHLGHARTPDAFSIGPVRLQKREAVMLRLELALADYVGGDPDQEAREYPDWLRVQASQYYQSFDWVAEVRINRCDPKTSASRALSDAQSALDCLHLLVGEARSKHMRVGGPSFSIDHRGSFVVDSEGKASIGISTDWRSPTLQDGWWDAVNSEGRREFVALMGLAITTGQDPLRPAPMAQRFLDSVAWYGEAVRDPFQASRLVKYVTAIERILCNSSKDNVAVTIAARGSAIVMPIEKEDRETLRQRFKDVYDLRSRLVHGSRSPMEPGLGEGLREAEHLTRAVLFGALLFFREEGLRAKHASDKRVESGFNRLLEWAEQEAARRAEPSPQAP